MVLDWLSAAIVTFVGILPIANPFSTAVVFLTITQSFSEEERLRQARLACIYMAAVLVTSLVAGAAVMWFFGISVPGVQIAGGLIVARIGFGMLQPEPEPRLSSEMSEEASHMRDVAFTPLAMPMLSGPGSIALTLSMAAEAEGPGEYVAIAAGIAGVAATAYYVLRASRPILGFLGPTGILALSRVMGFLLVCVAVQFVVDGIGEILSDAGFLAPILEALRRAE